MKTVRLLVPRIAGMVVVAALVAGIALASPAAATATKAAATKSTVTRKPGTAVRKPASKHTTGAETASAARSGGGPRRLEDIHIAGEIPAPQVLFVTARDQRRFMDSKHRQYLRTARQVAEATPLPSGVIVTRPEPGPR
jgi:hypothetical protein